MSPSANHPFYNAPYSGIPYAMFAIFFLLALLNPNSPPYTHTLIDPDHYMRLQEVVQWMQGQSWYDLSVPRMSPGAHTIVHWARLIDVPIALIALPFVPLLGLNDAVFVSSFIVPLLWFAALLALIPALARPFVGENRANLACLALLFAPMIPFCYTPGNVDHHGVQLIVAGAGLWCLSKMTLDEKGPRFAALAAIFLACGLWIGTESVPWIVLFVGCLGAAAAWHGGNVARNAALFGLLFPIVTTALIPLVLPVSEYSSLALSWFSPAYAVFAALCGGIFAAGWISGKFVPSRSLRLLLFILYAVAAASAFLALIPSSAAGPFADYNGFDKTTSLDFISEAQPLKNT
ncbi:MAG: hypothetical protein PHE27_00425, partial [Alphaproteobacteria bacterium]|nr:hypothetical protein [Alphaproteobacteria bacterium]